MRPIRCEVINNKAAWFVNDGEWVPCSKEQAIERLVSLNVGLATARKKIREIEWSLRLCPCGKRRYYADDGRCEDCFATDALAIDWFNDLNG